MLTAADIDRINAAAPYRREGLARISPDSLKEVRVSVDRLSDEESYNQPPDNYDPTAESWVD